MDFYSAYRPGFVRVAACTLDTVLADPAANAESVLRIARVCHDNGVGVAVLGGVAAIFAAVLLFGAGLVMGAEFGDGAHHHESRTSGCEDGDDDGPGAAGAPRGGLR